MTIKEEILNWYEESEERKALKEWFNNDKQNQELLKLYKSKHNVIEEIEAIIKEKEERLALHLLCVHPNYQKSKYKVMIIGQELNGGYGIKKSDGDIDIKLMMLDFFKTINSKHKKKPSGHFSNFSADFTKSINEETENNSYHVWTNIRKFSYRKKRLKDKVNKSDSKKTPRNKLPDKIQKIIDEEFNILADEIKIIKPDIVLFLIGPTKKYKDELEKQLKGIKYHEVDDYKKRELVRLEHEVLPYKSFRTYHPQYLKRNRKGIDLTSKYLKTLLEECKK